MAIRIQINEFIFTFKYSNNIDLDVAGSGFDPGEGVPSQTGFVPPPGQSVYPSQPERPLKPDFGASVPGGAAKPQHPGNGLLPPNHPWGGPADTEGSGHGYDDGEGSWNQGGPWQHPGLLSPNHWEPQQPSPGPVPSQSLQPHPVPSGVENNYQWPPNYYPDQQGSGDGILPGPNGFPQSGPSPVPLEIIPTTTPSPHLTTTPHPTSLKSTTSSSSVAAASSTSTKVATTITTEIPITPSPEPFAPFSPNVGENTRKVNKTNVISSQTSSPIPPISLVQVDDFDDEDFGEPPTATTSSHIMPLSTERPWDPHQPMLPFETEVGHCSFFCNISFVFAVISLALKIIR